MLQCVIRNMKKILLELTKIKTSVLTQKKVQSGWYDVVYMLAHMHIYILDIQQQHTRRFLTWNNSSEGKKHLVKLGDSCVNHGKDR